MKIVNYMFKINDRYCIYLYIQCLSKILNIQYYISFIIILGDKRKKYYASEKYADKSHSLFSILV